MSKLSADQLPKDDDFRRIIAYVISQFDAADRAAIQPVLNATGIDAVPVVPSVYDDEFNGNALDAKWMEYGTNYTLNVGGGSVRFKFPANRAGTNKAGFRQTLPAGNFTATAKIKVFWEANDSVFIGLFVQQAANNKYHGIGYVYNGAAQQYSLAVQRGGNDTDFTGLVNDVLYSSSSFRDVYFRIKYDGTNYYFQWSLDGGYFETAYQIAKLGFFSSQATLVGVGGYGFGSNEKFVFIDWFRVS